MPEVTEERLAQLERAEAALKSERLRNALTRSLEAAKCLPDGLKDALAIMMSSSEAEFTADGAISKLTVDGKSFDNVDAAASEFVGARKYLAGRHTIDGIEGGFGPGVKFTVAGQQITSGQDLESFLKSGGNAGDLIAEGWNKPPQ